MERKKGENNAQGLFGVERIPSDGQIRNLLDPVEPGALNERFWQIYRDLDEGGHLDKYEGVGAAVKNGQFSRKRQQSIKILRVSSP
jgi:hypothetical protein